MTTATAGTNAPLLASDEALRIAAQQPGARLGSIEVRPLFDFSGLNDSISIS